MAGNFVESKSICWRKYYTILTCCSSSKIEENELLDMLMAQKSSFLKGILLYTPCEPSSQLSKSTSPKDVFLYNLVKILRINLDGAVDLFGKYLTYDNVDTNELLKTEYTRNEVILSVWEFYSRERLFFLRCFNHIISSSVDKSCPYKEVFAKFLSGISSIDLYKSLVEQLEFVMNSNAPFSNIQKQQNEKLVPCWAWYNLREQLEILQMICVIGQTLTVDPALISYRISTLQATSYGISQLYLYTSNAAHKDLQNTIHLFAIFHTIQLLAKGWETNIYADDEELFLKHHQTITNWDKTIDPHKITFTVWLLVCYKSRNLKMVEKNLAADRITKCNFWQFISEFLDNKIVQEHPKLLDISRNLFDTLFRLLSSNFETKTVMPYNRRIDVIKKFISDDVDVDMPYSVYVCYNYFSERFPFYAQCFLALLNKMMASKKVTNVKNILMELNSLSYTDEYRSNYPVSNEDTLTEDVTILPYFPNLKIPRGTKVKIRSNSNLISFEYNLPFWDVMRNIVKLYTAQEITGKENRDKVFEFLTFCHNLLLIDMKITTDLLNAIEDTFDLMKMLYCNRTKVDTELLAKCLDVHHLLLQFYPMDVLTSLSVLTLLPNYDSYKVTTEDNAFSESSIVPSIIEKLVLINECSCGSYTLFISYLNFLLQLTRDEDTLCTWQVVAGIKMIFNVLIHIQVNAPQSEEEGNIIMTRCFDIASNIIEKGTKQLVVINTKRNAKLEQVVKTANRVTPSIHLLSMYTIEKIVAALKIPYSMVQMGERRFFSKIEKCSSFTKGRAILVKDALISSFQLINNALLHIEILKEIDESCMTPLNSILKQLNNPAALISYVHCELYPNIRILALKTLIRLAMVDGEYINYDIGLSKNRLRNKFILPLTNSAESSEYKVTLLVYIAKCILKQKSIASILMDIDELMDNTATDQNNLLVFLYEYLEKTKKEPDNMCSEIHSSVLHVIHSIWTAQYVFFQKYLKGKENFWTLMWRPFMLKPANEFAGYYYIMEIVITEIRSGNIDEKLQIILSQYLECEQAFVFNEYCLSGINGPRSYSIMTKGNAIQMDIMANTWMKLIIMIVSSEYHIQTDEARLGTSLLSMLINNIGSFNFELMNAMSDVYFVLTAIWQKRNSESWIREIRLWSVLLPLMLRYFKEYNKTDVYTSLFMAGNNIIQLANCEIWIEGEFIASCCKMVIYESSNVLLLYRKKKISNCATFILCANFLKQIIKMNNNNRNRELNISCLIRSQLISCISNDIIQLLKMECTSVTMIEMIEFLEFLAVEIKLPYDPFNVKKFVPQLWEYILPYLTRSQDDQSFDIIKQRSRNILCCNVCNLIRVLYEEYVTYNVTTDHIFTNCDQHLWGLFMILKIPNIIKSLDLDDLDCIIATLRFFTLLSESNSWNYTNPAIVKVVLESVYEIMILALTFISRPSSIIAHTLNIHTIQLDTLLSHSSIKKSSLILITEVISRLNDIIENSMDILAQYAMDVKLSFSSNYAVIKPNDCFVSDMAGIVPFHVVPTMSNEDLTLLVHYLLLHQNAFHRFRSKYGYKEHQKILIKGIHLIVSQGITGLSNPAIQHKEKSTYSYEVSFILEELKTFLTADINDKHTISSFNMESNYTGLGPSDSIDEDRSPTLTSVLMHTSRFNVLLINSSAVKEKLTTNNAISITAHELGKILDEIASRVPHSANDDLNEINEEKINLQSLDGAFFSFKLIKNIFTVNSARLMH